MRNKKSIVFLEIHEISTFRAGIAPVIKLVMVNFYLSKKKGAKVELAFRPAQV